VSGPDLAARPRPIAPMPFPVTRREKVILAVVALLIALGLVGMAVL
jgi:hypothetical protein